MVPDSWFWSRLFLKAKRKHNIACGDGDVLLAVDRVGHRSSMDLGTKGDMPELFAGGRIKRVEVTIDTAAED